MREFLFGVGVFFAILLVLGFTPAPVKYDEREIRNIYHTMQTKQFKIYTSTPAVSDLENGEIVIVQISDMNLFVRIKSNLYRVILTQN